MTVLWNTFFSSRLKNTYGVDIARAWEMAKRIPIVHVDGSLGAFSPSLLHRGAGSPFTPTEYGQAAESIRLMYEDRNSQPGVEEAKGVIKASECICFLGFGFDPDNIDRLELGTCCAPPPTGKSVVASRYQVGEGEWGRTVKRMVPGSLTPVNRDWDSLDLLRETNVLT